jgi:hypothetical protein
MVAASAHARVPPTWQASVSVKVVIFRVPLVAEAAILIAPLAQHFILSQQETIVYQFAEAININSMGVA